MSEDMAERKAAEAALRESEAKFRHLWESNRDALVLCFPPEWQLTGGNAAAVALFGAKDSAHLATLSQADLSPERQPDGELSSAKAQRLIGQAMDTGSTFFEWTHRRPDQTAFTAEVQLTRLTLDGVTGVQAAVRDITERNAAEAELKRTSEVLKEAQQVGQTGSFEYFSATNTLEWSAEQKRIHGLDPEGPSPTFEAALAQVVAQDREPVLAAFNAYMQGVGSSEWNYRVTGPDGAIRHLVTRAKLQVDPHGQGQRMVGTTQDITDHRVAEAAWQKADLARRHYLEQMSHEMRSPLQTILGMTDLLETTPLDEGQKRLLRPISNSTHALAAVVGDLLDLDRIEEQSITLQREWCNLWDILQECVEIGEAQASVKRFHVVNQMSPELPRKVFVDGARLQQIALNLVTNAVKYTERGEVVVATTFQHADQKSGAVNVHVRDTGIGIPPEEQSQLFRRGFRASTGLSRRGTGLRLVIARGLAEAMGGSLTLLNSTTSGSEFRLSIPVNYESEALQCVPEGERRNVLVLSPSAALRHTLSDWLQAAGHRVRQLHSYDWSGSEQDTTIDICLLDYRCASRNALRGFNGRIIGMNSYSDDSEPTWDRLLGMPPRRQELLDVINELCTTNDKVAEVTQRSSTSGDIASNDQHRGAHVLVVDDDPNARQWAVAVLDGAGCVVDVAPNGASALASIEAFRYDLVLLDQDLPDMAGVSVATHIVELDRLALQETTPIVALTADARSEMKSQCLAAGMADFLTKPTTARELVNIVAHRADTRTQVLLIDDSLDIQMLVRRVLAGDAIRTIPVCDIHEARRALRRSRVSLAIVDMQLGEFSGADVIRALRDEGAWGDLPFIALSGAADRGAEPAMRALGCSLYLNKPAMPSAILKSVRDLLRGSAQDAWHDKLLGHEAAEDDLSDLIPGYLASIKKDLVLAQSALARNEFDFIANVGHKMKGTGISYGFGSISKAGRLLENAAKAAQFGAVSTLLAELSQVLNEEISRLH